MDPMGYIITDIAGAEDELESLLLRYVCCATMAWKTQCFSKHLWTGLKNIRDTRRNRV